MQYKKILTPILICLLLIPLQAQQLPHGIARIEAAIEQDRLDDASKMFQLDVEQWLAQRNMDTLLAYIPLKGAITEKRSGVKAAVRDAYQFVAMLESKKLSALQSVNAYQSLAYYCESVYEMQDAFSAMETALSHAYQLTKDKDHLLGKCEYNLGVFSYKMGNIAQSEEHHRRSLAIKLKSRSASAEELYFSYNAFGTLYWHALKYDSASVYFTKAIEEVKKMPVDNINQNFRPAIIKNNLVAIYREEGNTSKALITAQEVISDFQRFLDGKGGDSKKQYAMESWCAAIDNLAGIYEEMGNYKRSEDLFLYAYQQKQQKLKNSYDIAVSEVLLGQHYNKTRDFQRAEEYLVKALKQLEGSDANYTFWQADAMYALAQVYENTARSAEAASAFEKSEQLYETAYAGSYDNTYIDFLNNKALFFAAHDRYEQAIGTARKTGDYLASVGEENSIQGFLHLLNLAEINYLARRHDEVVHYSNKALAHLRAQFRSGNNLLDSVRAEIHKPQAMLIKARSEYALQSSKDPVFLQKIYDQLDTAIQILERRKIFIEDAESINLLMSEYQGLINFFTQIALELYRQTSSDSYIEKFVNIREAALYSKIRSRLNKEKAIRFSNIPEAVIEKENKLKEQVQQSLTNTSADSSQFGQYLQASQQWQKFLDEQKRQYPQYYRLRYATLFYKLPELQQLIPENTTLVRYYMMDSSLVAMVADRNKRKIIQLSIDSLPQIINTVLQNTAGEPQQLSLLYKIYQQIWAPLSGDIQTKKVMVIPDGILYNVSIDMLPFEPVTSFSGLATKSLLARHTISYHYSPFMLESANEERSGYRNYIAFAPGFSDNLKSDYLQTIRDSLLVDRKYLTLLPQPANNRLTRKLKNAIGGELFLNGSSTAAAFRQHADKHKIIHIATHAEYNNNMPEQSGLFFAKEGDGANDNFLTLSEIYTCSMNADLMILTACESGKPGYQDGEGLVSLAHAFNYAGSRNILTALWKIDEQSSANIAEKFMEFLKKGLPTDEALRQAKLAYLAGNEGRVLAPAYWSGLVLMGKPLTLQLETPNSYWAWILAAAGLIVVAVVLWLIRKNSKSKKQQVRDQQTN